jgi:phospholipid-translocating ATPase/phospholipid-transporting ATPase
LTQELAVATREHSSVHPRALIIDGPSLIVAMDGVKYPKLREALLSFSKKCKAVVACRVSPDQKRQMVDLIKKGVQGVQTLAVGDGANDVAMIQEAHVGVGIKGEEGLQAVNSADYAIAQFRYLTPLILKHGRYNYLRMSRLVCYIFYKNIMMSLCMFWFNFNCGFSGQKYFTEGAIQMFNLIFTSLPILAYAAADKDMSVGLVYKFPAIYKACIDGVYFTSSLFWRWVVTGILESVVISVLSLYFLDNASPGVNGGTSVGFWGSGALAYTIIVFVVNLKVSHWSRSFSLPLFVSCYLSHPSPTPTSSSSPTFIFFSSVLLLKLTLPRFSTFRASGPGNICSSSLSQSPRGSQWQLLSMSASLSLRLTGTMSFLRL